MFKSPRNYAETDANAIAEKQRAYREERKLRVANRIASRIAAAVDNGHREIEIKGGPLGIKRTRHTTDVYAVVAGQLAQDEVGIVVDQHTKFGNSDFLGILLAADGSWATERIIDVASITRVDNQAIDYRLRGDRSRQIYPPR